MTDERKNKANGLGKLGKKRRKAFCVFALFLTFVFLFVSLFFVFKSPILEYLYKDYQAPAPVLHSEWAKKPTYLADGDIYVSLNGSDENDGSKNSPFKTLERAKRAVRELDKRDREQIVVCIEGGDYQSTLSLNAEDGGSADCPIIYRGVNGTAVLDGGNILNPKDFRPALHSKASRHIFRELSDDLQKHSHLLQPSWNNR
jgi:hypothetical protein